MLLSQFGCLGEQSQAADQYTWPASSTNIYHSHKPPMGAACCSSQSVTPQRVVAKDWGTKIGARTHAYTRRSSNPPPTNALETCFASGHELSHEGIVSLNCQTACDICRTIPLPVGSKIRSCTECAYVTCEKCYQTAQDDLAHQSKVA